MNTVLPVTTLKKMKKNFPPQKFVPHMPFFKKNKTLLRSLNNGKHTHKKTLGQKGNRWFFIKKIVLGLFLVF